MVASATRRDAIAMAQGTTTDRASDRSAKSSCVSVLTWGCCSTSVERTTVAMARIAVGVPGRRCNLLKSDSLDMFIGHQPKIMLADCQLKLLSFLGHTWGRCSTFVESSTAAMARDTVCVSRHVLYPVHVCGGPCSAGAILSTRIRFL